ncbi:UDP-N-acetylmuramate dehydrogenase [Devosia nitrariae]|uniref:UDP-N-acetylenolpyruvoylglucosamine reductase n=1 Tax=Devosia nitrariae TaxID=2071872 RepID=A0ABQ5W296_9HYPH|nr:UDP-N-acetylmuramate dehydrogenase [Devosia nitrariae]GLQ54030.1 UDP-N-acetylenolpyruvoylglucosamine reductase [Devosia nitrariae]
MELTPDFDLSPFNTLGLASKARYGAVISARDEIGELMAFAASAGLPLHIVGGGSNLVLRDDLEAVVGVMAIKGRTIERRDDGSALVTAKAGEDWSQFVAWTVSEGLRGLENLAGIPGTVGAAPIQNIGAYGVELAERLESLTVLDTQDGKERRFTPDECKFSYRQSLFKQLRGRFIVTEATFALPRAWAPVLTYPGLDSLPRDADASVIMERVLTLRASKLPDWRVIGNVGSFFHNPVVRPEMADAITGGPRYPQPDGTVKLSAAWLIDACGLKGHRHGQAGIYEGHALIVVNHGGATYREVSELSAKVSGAVEERFGVTLTREPIEL